MVRDGRVEGVKLLERDEDVTLELLGQWFDAPCSTCALSWRSALQ